MQKPKTLALFTKKGSDPHLVYIKKVIEILSPYQMTVLLPENLRLPLSAYDGNGVRFLPDEASMLKQADMVLVLGGDGTMIKYGVPAAELGKPTAGVNLGTLGFLTALERHELEGLSALGTGDFMTEERMLLEVMIENEQGNIIHRQNILNDVVVSTGVVSKIAEFSLCSGKEKLLAYRADGIIIATPTGSTAYSFSAGGPVIDPTAEIIEVTPVCPHTLLRGSLMFAPDTKLTIQGKTRDTLTDIHVTMDGKNSQLIPHTAKIHIQKSQYTVKIVKIGSNRFYDILETKLNRK